jgi:hypothetical protein
MDLLPFEFSTFLSLDTSNEHEMETPMHPPWMCMSQNANMMKFIHIVNLYLALSLFLVHS